ncbi:IclR family transcriptional regulator [Salinicoccus carnicancri]|uniref:IclR family transcriptional regulator n=1 Tax=Salinicoccus carnicancri TaxID=558170 RepID=UPI0002EA2EB7|nr:IclR family transcriptional regulator [Salinicoccus carnicancri]
MKAKSDVSATVLRAMKILKHLKEATGPQSISYISKNLDISPTIVHRLLTTLKMEGFVFQDSQTKLYSLGTVFMEYSNRVMTQLPFSALVEAKVLQLRNLTEETVGFYIQKGYKRLCLIEHESQKEIRRSVGVGKEHPIHKGATGRALLAYQPEKVCEEILENLMPEERNLLEEKIKAVKQHGFALSYGEVTDEVSALSAPVFDYQGRLIGALSISGPSFRFSEEMIQSYIPALLTTASEISQGFQ